MCICITHACFVFYVLLSRGLWWCTIVLWHAVFNEQFIFILHFYWLILPHLDCHVNHDWLHVERFQGTVPRIWADRIWDGLGPSIYIEDVLYTKDDSWFIRLSKNWLTFCTVVSPALPSLHPSWNRSRESGVSEPTLVIWDLHGCRRIRFLRSALARPLVLFLPRVLHRRFLHLFVHGIHLWWCVIAS
jgi:hypothetical protein